MSQIAFNSQKEVIKIQGIVSNVIRITDCNRELGEYCHNELTIPNPMYAKLKRMGKWVGNTPQTIQFYYTCGDEVIIPYGCLSDVIKIVGKESMQSAFTMTVKVDYPTTILDSLRDYQKVAVEEMYKAHYGILQSRAGSGKTHCGIALACKLKRRTLWVTHTLQLLNQSKARAEQYISKDLIGTIAEGKINISNGITFATVQTLSNMDLTEVKNFWDVIIVDECHRCCSTPNEVTMFGKVLNNLSARHKYGLSATVHRADGLIKGCFALLGKVQYAVPDEAIQDNVMDVSVVPIFTPLPLTSECCDTDGTLDYNKIMKYITTNDERNQLIADVLEDKPTLILSSRTEHLKSIRAKLPIDRFEQSVYIDGKMTSKKAKVEREQAIQDMRDRKKKYLFATFSLAKEGLDIPCLERVILATPEKDEAVIIQSVGRVSRVCEGKDPPKVVDIVDGEISMLWKKYKARCRIYKKEKIQIETV